MAYRWLAFLIVCVHGLLAPLLALGLILEPRASEREPSAPPLESSMRRLGVGRHDPSPEPAFTPTVPGLKWSAVAHVRRSAIEDILAELGSGPSPLRVIPWLEGGSLEGFQLLGVSPGSLLWAAGLRSGDVIRRLDGEPLSAPALDMRVGPLGPSDSLTIDLTRQGAPGRLVLFFEDDLRGSPLVARRP